MRKSEIYDKCVYEIEQALMWNKLVVVGKDGALSKQHKHNCVGVVLSSVEGKAGPVSRAWGVAYTGSR